MMRTRSWKRIGLSVLIVALAAACRSPVDRPPREALGDWLHRTQGLVGVFPPREDVRVGDVHIYLRDPEGADPVSLYEAPRWSYLPSSELLEAGYRLRPEYPPTSADYLKTGVAPEERSWPESTGKPGFLEPGAPIDRLRSIQFPSFAHYRREAGELPPSWGLHQVLEENYDDWEVIRIRIEAAETASLALEDAVRAYLERRGSSFYLPASLRQNLRALAPDGLRTIWVRIVTEVIYMRAMRVTIVTESDFDLIEDLIENEASSAQLGDGGSDEEGDSELSDEELDSTYAAIARANAMNRKMI